MPADVYEHAEARTKRPLTTSRAVGGLQAVRVIGKVSVGRLPCWIGCDLMKPCACEEVVQKWGRHLKNESLVSERVSALA